jgi:hypothetical protein
VASISYVAMRQRHNVQIDGTIRKRLFADPLVSPLFLTPHSHSPMTLSSEKTDSLGLKLYNHPLLWKKTTVQS